MNINNKDAVYGWWSDDFVNSGRPTNFYKRKDNGEPIEVCVVANEEYMKNSKFIKMVEVGEWIRFGRPDTRHRYEKF